MNSGSLKSFMFAAFAVAIVPPVMARELPSMLNGPDRAYTISDDLSALPLLVRQKRQLLIDVARTGDLSALTAVINGELDDPWLSPGGIVDDAFEHLRYSSIESQGAETLAALIEILESPYAVIGEGENAIYVWPYLTEIVGQRHLTPSEFIDLFRLIDMAAYRDMLKAGEWQAYRALISARGEWLGFFNKPFAEDAPASTPEPAFDPAQPMAGTSFSNDLAALPIRVQAMRQRLIDIVDDSDVEKLRPLIAGFALNPVFNFMVDVHPIDFMRSHSADGSGRETLEQLKRLLEMPYARIDNGYSPVLYVWPAQSFAATQLAPEQRVSLEAVTTSEHRAFLNALSPESAMSTAIFADGSWSGMALQSNAALQKSLAERPRN